jgi:hypothetical protein
MSSLELGDDVRLSGRGLQLPKEITLSHWQQIGTKLAHLVNASAWAIGDWAHYGTWTYGSKYRAAIAVTGLDYGTLANYASVAGRFDFSRRREKLSFAHHAEVSALPVEEQDRWLDQAEHYGWSRQQLRDELRGRRELVPGLQLALVRVQVDVDREQRWERAAEQAECELVDWIANTLDAAAAAQLEA